MASSLNGGLKKRVSSGGDPFFCGRGICGEQAERR